MPRYHFDEFVLSPRRRVLLRGGREQPLIPRYFDLLVFLVERRHEAVHRRDIFEKVWSDANVSDSALSQAIRTIRVALDDDSREPRFIRTVSRHGYRFVFDVVREEDEEDTPAARVPASRLAAASIGAGLAGLAAGIVGGLMLALVPGSSASFAMAPVLGLVGAACGAAGGLGVGAGVLAGDKTSRVPRAVGCLFGGAIGGAVIGTTAEWLSRWSLAALVGVHINTGGGIEGLAIGAAAGLGYGLAGSDLRRTVMLTAGLCGVAALGLSLAGRPLVGGTIHAIASAATGSQATLTALGRLIGEPGFGPISRAIIGTGEAVIFGLGFSLGLTKRAS